MENNYKEILKLKGLLEIAKIPFETLFKYNGLILKYPSFNSDICSVIEHDYSYGNNEDLIEIMGLLTDEEKEYDDVVGCLTAEDVFNRIKNHYECILNKNISIIKCPNCGATIDKNKTECEYCGTTYEIK